jgi:L-ascorbate metabolism protein UlaG (beta-lactamase superfamily)
VTAGRATATREAGPDAADAGGAPARCTWLGHATALVELAGRRVLTDPVFRARLAHLRRDAAVAPSAVAALDAILISHVHQDHLDLRSLAALPRATPVVAPRGAGALLRRHGRRQVIELAEDDRAEVAGVAIHAVPAEHHARRSPLGPRVRCLGYVLEGPPRVYFAGDTDLFYGMRDIGRHLDVALLPVAGWGPRLPPGHLTPERAAQALVLLQPRIAIPIHWGTYRPVQSRRPLPDAAREFAALATRIAPSVDVRVLPLGGTCDLTPAARGGR